MLGYMDTVKDYGAEPTLYDVIEAMQNGFAYMERRFSRVDEQFVELREGLKQDIAELREENAGEHQEIKRRLFRLELQGEDKSEILQEHGKRLTSLESWKKATQKRGLAGA